MTANTAWPLTGGVSSPLLFGLTLSGSVSCRHSQTPRSVTLTTHLFSSHVPETRWFPTHFIMVLFLKRLARSWCQTDDAYKSRINLAETGRKVDTSSSNIPSPPPLGQSAPLNPGVCPRLDGRWYLSSSDVWKFLCSLLPASLSTFLSSAETLYMIMKINLLAANNGIWSQLGTSARKALPNVQVERTVSLHGHSAGTQYILALRGWGGRSRWWWFPAQWRVRVYGFDIAIC